MPVVYTIGYKGKSLETFITQLRTAHVDAIIDIRLRNTSHLAGYTKKDTLAFLLPEGFGIAYEHHPELAPTSQIMDAYRQNADWAAYQSRFLPLLQERACEEVGQAILQRYHAPCLLCAEPTAQQCHRRLVAEYWTAHLPELTIVHL
ncbi:MAG: DUF488 domain-containing protein [Anaerolineae bacterium]|nr:DUF488 domain-containing protein [Anaerolineae bacterium]